MNVIEVKDLCKSYGTNQVLKGISLSIRKGEIFALLGANGAGKTTMLECIEKIRRYDSGSIEVKARCGVQLQTSSLPQNIKAMEAITLFARWNHTKIDYEELTALGVDSLKNKQYKDMSTGQKRRLHLALAMLGEPDILFLDEPTAGLDIEGRIALHKQMKAIRNSGRTIVLASHDMAEIEELCDRIAILKGGQVVFEGTPAELAQSRDDTVTVHMKTNAGDKILKTSDLTEDLLHMLNDFKTEGIAVADIYVERESLEERFVSVAKEGI